MFKDLYPKGQAHNFVLSASSPVLQNIIVKSTPPDLSERNSESWINIAVHVYGRLGEAREARCFHERIEGFIKVAKDLEVKEIYDSFGRQYENQSDDIWKRTHFGKGRFA